MQIFMSFFFFFFLLAQQIILLLFVIFPLTNAQMKKQANETWGSLNGSAHSRANHSKAADKIDSTVIEHLSNEPVQAVVNVSPVIQDGLFFFPIRREREREGG